MSTLTGLWVAKAVCFSPQVILQAVPGEKSGVRKDLVPGPSGESTAYRRCSVRHRGLLLLLTAAAAAAAALHRSPRCRSVARRAPWHKCSNRNVCQWNSSGPVQREKRDHDAAVPFIKLLQPSLPAPRWRRRGREGVESVCEWTCFVCACVCVWVLRGALGLALHHRAPVTLSPTWHDTDMFLWILKRQRDWGDKDEEKEGRWNII